MSSRPEFIVDGRSGEIYSCCRKKFNSLRLVEIYIRIFRPSGSPSADGSSRKVYLKSIFYYLRDLLRPALAVKMHTGDFGFKEFMDLIFTEFNADIFDRGQTVTCRNIFDQISGQINMKGLR